MSAHTWGWARGMAMLLVILGALFRLPRGEAAELNCPGGEYLINLGNMEGCIPCPPGTFREEGAVGGCATCPPLSTANQSSSNITDCRVRPPA